MEIKMTPTFLEALKASLKISLSEPSYNIMKDASAEDDPEVVEMLIGRAVVNELITDALKD